MGEIPTDCGGLHETRGQFTVSSTEAEGDGQYRDETENSPRCLLRNTTTKTKNRCFCIGRIKGCSLLFFNIKFNSVELDLTTLFHYSLLLFTFQKILNAESVNSEK